MIYWANQHTALVAGIWWWIFFPVLLVVMTFIGLFLLAVSMNEYIDPRSRLGRTGSDDDAASSPVEGLRAYYRTSAFGVRARGARGRRRQLRASRPDEIYGLAGEFEQRQDHADQDHRRRHPAAAARCVARHGHVQFPRPARSTCTRVDRDELARDPLAASLLHHAGLDERAEPGAPGPPRLRRLRLPPYRPADAAVPRHGARRISRACISQPDVLDAYPHQLSGGMRQRVTIALATVCRPEFIIADEPTTALDVVVQKDVLAMIREIQRELGSSILFVTHDMAVHANLTDRLGIMYAGRLVEEGRTADLFRAPRHPYTAHLIASLPRHRRHGAEGGARRHAAQPRRSAAGLPLPSALPARDGHLPARGAAAGGAGARPSRRLLPSRRSRRHERALLELDDVEPHLRAAACSRAGRSWR